MLNLKPIFSLSSFTFGTGDILDVCVLQTLFLSVLFRGSSPALGSFFMLICDQYLAGHSKETQGSLPMHFSSPVLCPVTSSHFGLLDFQLHLLSSGSIELCFSLPSCAASGSPPGREQGPWWGSPLLSPTSQRLLSPLSGMQCLENYLSYCIYFVWFSLLVFQVAV